MTAAMYEDPQGRALVAAIHTRKQGAEMTDRLARIQARANDPFGTLRDGIGQVDEDRDYLLAMVREQDAKLEAVSKIASRLEDRATLNARVSATGIYDEQMQLAADAASSIAIVTAGDLRAAITATEEKV